MDTVGIPSNPSKIDELFENAKQYCTRPESRKRWGDEAIRVVRELLTQVGASERGGEDADGRWSYLNSDGDWVATLHVGYVEVKSGCTASVLEKLEPRGAKKQMTDGYLLPLEGSEGSASESSRSKEATGVTRPSLEEELCKYKNVILEGVAGCGKTYAIKALRESGKYSRTEVVVFHPSTSYEEFVSGLRPNPDKPDQFVGLRGVFVEMCDSAAAKPEEKFLLCIDEINRANTARVLGDLLMPLEASKRVAFDKIGQGQEKTALFEAPPKDTDGAEVVAVRLQTPIRGKAYLVVPANLHVLGTMNSTDRSVGTLDLALRRRFHWHRMEPLRTKQELDAALRATKRDPAEFEELILWYLDINEKLEEEVGPDAMLGHSYFFLSKPQDISGEPQDISGDIEDQLLRQLEEIIFTFNVREDVLKLFKNSPIGNKKIVWVGKGLGERPMTRSETTPRQKMQENPSTASGASAANS